MTKGEEVFHAFRCRTLDRRHDQYEGQERSNQSRSSGSGGYTLSHSVNVSVVHHSKFDRRLAANGSWVGSRRERIHKSHHKDAATMTDYKQKLSDIAKREGVVVIAKIMVAENRAYCITESELAS